MSGAAARRGTAAPGTRTPAALGVPAALAVALLAVPLVALLARAPWSDLPRLLARPEALAALRLSLVTASTATAFATALGVPLAWVLARSGSRWVPALRALVTVPVVLPPVVGGLALLLAFGRRGLAGRPLEALGITLPFSTAAVVLAQVFVAMPFLVLSVEGALRSADRGLEEAAATLGSGTGDTFRRVTLPLVLPGVVAGAVLCWARALGEFGATITFAGNLVGRTQTLPLAVYQAFQSDPESATALSLVLLAVAVVVLAGMRRRWWRAAVSP